MLTHDGVFILDHALALYHAGRHRREREQLDLMDLVVFVCARRSSAAEALLEGGAQVDTPDRAGRTALSYAAMYGSTDCIYLLAGRGADVGHVDADGNTPLELAEGSGRQSAVDALKKLQLRVKMQEKRKVGWAGCTGVLAGGAVLSGGVCGEAQGGLGGVYGTLEGGGGRGGGVIVCGACSMHTKRG
jgi:hypothetical protein